MTHLTTKQILQMVDGTLDYASQAQYTSHLAVCERCRKEIEFQKAVAKASRRQPVVNTSAGFVRNVMHRIVPEQQKSWKTRLVDNLGNIFAMCLVLAILGYAITTPSLFQEPEQSSQQSIVPPVVSETYTKIIDAFSTRAQEATSQLTGTKGNDGTRMVSLMVVSLLLLAAIDQFVIKRFVGMKMKH